MLGLPELVQWAESNEPVSNKRRTTPVRRIRTKRSWYAQRGLGEELYKAIPVADSKPTCPTGWKKRNKMSRYSFTSPKAMCFCQSSGFAAPRAIRQAATRPELRRSSHIRWQTRRLRYSCVAWQPATALAPHPRTNNFQVVSAGV